MDSIKVSKLFPEGTVIVAYKGRNLGGAKAMPEWKIEPVINEKRYFRSSDGLLAKLAVDSSISLEFEAVNPQYFGEYSDLRSFYDFDGSPGELTFAPLDPENGIVYYFPSAELKNEPEIKKYSVRWKFEIFPADDGAFMTKFKTN